MINCNIRNDNMSNSKVILIAAGIIICFILAGCVFLSDSISDSDSNLNENSDDAGYIWMEDENGNMKLTPVTETSGEGSASAPG